MRTDRINVSKTVASFAFIFLLQTYICMFVKEIYSQTREIQGVE